MQIIRALSDAVVAAAEFKYWLDIQHPGSLFDPSGADARATTAFAQAAESLARAQTALERLQRAECPRQVLLVVVPVRDVVTQDGADAPAGALDILAQLGRKSRVEVSNERADGTKERCSLDFGGRIQCLVGELFELADGEAGIVHGGLRVVGTSVEQALAAGFVLSERSKSLPSLRLDEQAERT